MSQLWNVSTHCGKWEMTAVALPWKMQNKNAMGHSSSFPNESLKKSVSLGSFHEKEKIMMIIYPSLLLNTHRKPTRTSDIHQPVLTGVFATTHMPTHKFEDITSFPKTHQSNYFQPQDKALAVLSWSLWTQFKSKYAVLLWCVKAPDAL